MPAMLTSVFVDRCVSCAPQDTTGTAVTRAQHLLRGVFSQFAVSKRREASLEASVVALQRRLRTLDEEARYAAELQAQLDAQQAREASASASDRAAVVDLRARLAAAEERALRAAEQVEALSSAKVRIGSVCVPLRPLRVCTMWRSLTVSLSLLGTWLHDTPQASAEQARDMLTKENLKLMEELETLEASTAHRTNGSGNSFGGLGMAGMGMGIADDRITLQSQQQGDTSTSSAAQGGAFAIIKTGGATDGATKKPIESLLDQENAASAFVPVRTRGQLWCRRSAVALVAAEVDSDMPRLA